MSTTLNTNPLFIQGSVVGYKAQTATALGTLRTLEVQRILSGGSNYWLIFVQ